MSKNDLILLDAIIDKIDYNHIAKEDCGKKFDFFATTQILKDFAFNDEDLLIGNVDGRNDGGIDDFFIIVNGHLAENIPNEFWPKSNAELEIYIITSKHDDSFKQGPLTTLIPTLLDLFDMSKQDEELKNSYNDGVLRKRKLLFESLKKVTPFLVKFNINIFYTCRGDESIVEDNIQSKADQIKDICYDYFSNCFVDVHFFGNESLLKACRTQQNISISLDYIHCINDDGQYVVLAKISDYYKFLSLDNKKINKHLFDSNVRDYLGLNPVNAEILDSLNSKNETNFWWLNNGITMLGSSASIVGKTISIENPQIVNGLQTSESIFKYFSANEDFNDDRLVLIKILLLEDNSLKNKIIYATNNQTNVMVSNLHANDDIQKDIEDVLKKHGLYYGRKDNYYENLGIPKEQIIKPLVLATSIVNLIYKNPYLATTLKQRFMRDPYKYECVFSKKFNVELWSKLSQIYTLNDEYLLQLREEMHISNKNKFCKIYRHIFMFLTLSRLFNKFSFSEKDLLNLNLKKYTYNEILITYNDLIELYPNLFMNKQKLAIGIYNRSFKFYKSKYEVKNIECIRDKQLSLFPNSNTFNNVMLSKTTIDLVRKNIPNQPWKVNMHKELAVRIKKSEVEVCNAISYLIHNDEVNAQVYGYVFDSTGNIVSEGEHYGHSEQEARDKVEKQRGKFTRMFDL